MRRPVRRGDGPGLPPPPPDAVPPALDLQLPRAASDLGHGCGAHATSQGRSCARSRGAARRCDGRALRLLINAVTRLAPSVKHALSLAHHIGRSDLLHNPFDRPLSSLHNSSTCRSRARASAVAAPAVRCRPGSQAASPPVLSDPSAAGRPRTRPPESRPAHPSAHRVPAAISGSDDDRVLMSCRRQRAWSLRTWDAFRPQALGSHSFLGV